MKITFWKQLSEKHYMANLGNAIEGHITVQKDKRYHPYVIKNKTELQEDWKSFKSLDEAKNHCRELKKAFNQEIVLFL